jgi:hypothetical protein
MELYLYSPIRHHGLVLNLPLPGLFYDTFVIADYIAPNYMMIDELESIWKEEVVA